MEAAQVKMTPGQLVERYFVSYLEDDDQKQVCKLCYPDWEAGSDIRVKTLTKGAKGNTWAVQHLNGKHAGYNNQTLSRQTLLVSRKASDTCDWIDWIVSENREIDFCEKPRVRKHTKGKRLKINIGH
jgi:hypothetical protein